MSAVADSLGQRLARLRRERGLSRAEVADATEMSASFLALVEQGKSDISVGRLIRLVHFDNVRLMELVPEADAVDPVVVKAAEQPSMSSPSDRIQTFLLTSGPETAMLPMRIVYEPGATTAENWPRRGGEEVFMHVVNGRIDLRLENHRPIVLEKGDTAYFPSERFVGALNPLRRPVEVISASARRAASRTGSP